MKLYYNKNLSINKKFIRTKVSKSVYDSVWHSFRGLGWGTACNLVYDPVRLSPYNMVFAHVFDSINKGIKENNED